MNNKSDPIDIPHKSECKCSYCYDIRYAQDMFHLRNCIIKNCHECLRIMKSFN